MEERKVALDKYRHERCPEGRGVLYRFKRKTGSLKAYIGITGDFPQRLRAHVNGRHDASRSESVIHSAIKKYGIDAFDIEILDYLPEEELPNEEVEAIAFQKTVAPLGYNLNEGGDRARPCKQTLVKKSVSMTKAIKDKSPEELAEWRANMGIAQSKPETKAVHSKSMTNWWKNVDEQTRSLAVERSKATRDTQLVSRLDEARARALPFELNPAKRIKGQLYIRYDGKIGCANAQGKLPLICPGHQTEVMEKKLDKYRALALPFEPQVKKRVCGQLYVRYDGKIGRANIHGKLPLVCSKQQV